MNGILQRLINAIAAQVAATVKTELDELRADLPAIVEAGVEGVVTSVLHPFSHAETLRPLEEQPITQTVEAAIAQPLTPEQRARLEALRDKLDPRRRPPR